MQKVSNPIPILNQKSMAYFFAKLRNFVEEIAEKSPQDLATVEPGDIQFSLYFCLTPSLLKRATVLWTLFVTVRDSSNRFDQDKLKSNLALMAVQGALKRGVTSVTQVRYLNTQYAWLRSLRCPEAKVWQQLQKLLLFLSIVGLNCSARIKRTRR